MAGIDDILSGNFMSEENFNSAYNAMIKNIQDGVYLFIASNYEIPEEFLSPLEKNVEKLIREPREFDGSKPHMIYAAKGSQGYLKSIYDGIRPERIFKKLVEKKGRDIVDLVMMPKTETIGSKSRIFKTMQNATQVSVQTLYEQVSPVQFRKDVESYVRNILKIQNGYFFAAMYTGDKETIVLPDADKHALGKEIKFRSGNIKYHLYFRQFTTPAEGYTLFENVKRVNDFLKVYGKVRNGKPEYTTPNKMQQEAEKS